MRLFPITPPLPVGEIGDALDTCPDTPEDSTKLEAMRVVMMLVALLGMLAPAMAFVAAAPMRVQSRSATPVMGNNAPEGPFTPIVLAGKVVLGEKLFNKIRGKGISIHSQVITEFCEDFGTL